MSIEKGHEFPPAYREKLSNEETEDANGYFVKINAGKIPSINKTSLQSRKEESSPSIEGFRYLQPVAVRSLAKFFNLPANGIPSCDRASTNFGYNLWYFQLNYALLLTLVVLIAMQEIQCHQFSLEVHFTAVVMAMVYLLNCLGCRVQVLGRKLKISEQLTVIFILMVVCNGLLPGAFDFIYFCSAYLVFVVVHASIIQVPKACFTLAAVHHI